ncbi:hypothetical protein C8R46DRAFT_1076674 [Mycena filopes]|nr:hypothetical protein C8R46DRAFT_1076674 [Mycena filopes]
MNGRRWMSSLPREFEALVDRRPRRAALPLDAIVTHTLPPTKPVTSQTLAREIRACIAANDIVAALAILRGVSKPYPRLLAHAAVHALLRVDADRAGSLLLAFATEPATFVKLPRLHPLTLDKTVKALFRLIPKTQGRQDRARIPQKARILSLDAEMVSEPALRTALALYLRARKLFVPRRKEATFLLWKALLDQREFVPAALFFQLQVMDFQLSKSLPTILHSPDPAAGPLTPHDRDYLARRLAVLKTENIRPSDSLFADLCYRIHGVLSNITRHAESGYAPQHLIETLRRAIVGTVPVSSDRFPDTDPDAMYASTATDEPRNPLTPARAKHHVRLALQALTILGVLVHTRQIPFPDIARWIYSLPLSLASEHVYTKINGIPTSVAARDHLRDVLEVYASALPRTPHIYSTFHFDSGGFIRRGLKHLLVKHQHKSAELASTIDSTDVQFPKIRFSPPDDPVEAADDSLMPPPALPTYQALLGVFLNDDRALLYESMSSKTAATTVVELEPQAPSAGTGTTLDRDDWMEMRVHQHYHAPRSPNNPNPRIRYPAHPLDFHAYPAPPVPPVLEPDADIPTSKLGGGETQRRRAHLAARVITHMMRERNPALPPWQSAQIMRLLARRTEVLEPVLEEHGLWEELWAEARRLSGGPSLDDNENGEEAWAVEERLRVERNVEWDAPRQGWQRREEEKDL